MKIRITSHCKTCNSNRLKSNVCCQLCVRIPQRVHQSCVQICFIFRRPGIFFSCISHPRQKSFCSEQSLYQCLFLSAAVFSILVTAWSQYRALFSLTSILKYTSIYLTFVRPYISLFLVWRRWKTFLVCQNDVSSILNNQYAMDFFAKNYSRYCILLIFHIFSFS